ncbi:MAG: diacylglycerol/lipid kinase family protein [Planctomycetota bacterium]
MPRRVRVIVNPISGRGRAKRITPPFLRRLEDHGFEVDHRTTARRGDAMRFAEQTSGLAAVACVGGDGTLNEVLNGLPERNAPPIAFVPCGTSNVAAREFGLPRRPEDVADAVRDGRLRRVDAGVDRNDGRRFLLFAGAGFPSIVVEEFHRRRKGRIFLSQYILWGLRLLRKYPIPRLTVEIDGEVITRDAAWAEVTNAAEYGGPLCFTPHARSDDGLFDVMILPSRLRREPVRMFYAAFLTGVLPIHYRLPDLLFLRGRRVKISATDGARVPVHFDGDPGGEVPVDLEVLPQGACLLVS